MNAQQLLTILDNHAMQSTTPNMVSRVLRDETNTLRAVLKMMATGDRTGGDLAVVLDEVKRTAIMYGVIPESELDPIVRFVVRRPGNTSWKEIAPERNAEDSVRKALRQAIASAERANSDLLPGHHVYGERRSGAVTGPLEW